MTGTHSPDAPSRARPASTESFRLAEGPIWDADRQLLHWVDITAGQVLTGALVDGRVVVTERVQFERTAGAVLLLPDGGRVVAAHDRLVRMSPDGQRTDGPVLVAEPDRRRLNDAIVDAAGRILAGTLSLDGPSRTEELFAVSPDGAVRLLDDDLTLSNGLAFSADGTKLYSVDTLRHTVFVRHYDISTGDVGQRQTHLRITDALPDGITVDADDHLWVAMWGAGEVRRYAPDGSLVHTVRTDAPHTSSLTLAGPALDVLVITTAVDELTDAQLTEHPHSGRLFSFELPR